MRIANKRRGLWFVLVIRDDGRDSLVLCPYEGLCRYLGQFAWVDDVKGIFTNHAEAREYFYKLVRQKRYR